MSLPYVNLAILFLSSPEAFEISVGLWFSSAWARTFIVALTLATWKVQWITVCSVDVDALHRGQLLLGWLTVGR